MEYNGIDTNYGYPFGITVREYIGDSEEDKDKERALRDLRIFHDLQVAIDAYVRITHEKFKVKARVSLFVLGQEKAPDGVFEQKNEIISEYIVKPDIKKKTFVEEKECRNKRKPKKKENDNN